MFARLPDVESDVDRFIEQESYNDALVNILVGVHNHFKLPNVVGNALYYEHLDRLVLKLADCLYQAVKEKTQAPLTSNTLIVASELFPVGGHSRVIADIARAIPMTTIVLTDMFWRLRKNPDAMNWQFDTYPDSTIITLHQLSPWEKCKALYQITRRLQPSNILYFNHHEDPIPFVGTLRHTGSRKTLVHHCDHNPSLGNTLHGMAHVDFTDEMAAECRSNLRRETRVLPLFVADLGRKVKIRPANAEISAVTSGSSNKFLRDGVLALQNIVRAVLTTIDGSFFHIGQIDEDWANDIKVHLVQEGIDPTRYVLLGSVPSLWKTLAEIEADVYIASAPLGGGRAAIEAQGCGYPVLFYSDSSQRSALGTVSLYARSELGWSDVTQLREILARLQPDLLPELADAARDLYETRYSETQFKDAIKAMIQ